MKPFVSVDGPLGVLHACAGETVISVAPSGDDGDFGTATRPFVTLERTRDAARGARGT